MTVPIYVTIKLKLDPRSAPTRRSQHKDHCVARSGWGGSKIFFKLDCFSAYTDLLKKNAMYKDMEN